jgi:hypothetical protein
VPLEIRVPGVAAGAMRVGRFGGHFGRPTPCERILGGDGAGFGTSSTTLGRGGALFGGGQRFLGGDGPAEGVGRGGGSAFPGLPRGAVRVEEPGVHAPAVRHADREDDHADQRHKEDDLPERHWHLRG